MLFPYDLSWKFRTPNLDGFVRLLFAHSPRTRLWWKDRTGKAMTSYSPTHWWSKWEVMSQVLSYFGDVTPLILRCLQLQIRNTPDQVLPSDRVSCCGVKATYNLEGDGPLVLKCFEVLSTLVADIQVGHYPNVQAIAKALSAGSSAVIQQWVDYAKACTFLTNSHKN